MKKFSLFLMLMVASIVFYACSNSSEDSGVNPNNTTTTSTNVLTEVVTLESDVNTFISGFYNGSVYEIGRQIETYDEAENTYLVSEILVGTELNARGYMVTDLHHGSPLYFVDVDRVNNMMTSVDIIADETTTTTQINQHNEYVSTDAFDLIDITQDMNSGSQEATTKRGKRPFWGWGTIDESPEFTGPDGRCRKVITERRHIFWIRVGKKNKREVDC